MRIRSLKLWFRILEQEVGSPESVGAEVVVCVCWGHSPASRVTCPMPTGVLPGAAPPGAAHGQRHAEVGLHTQRHHRAEKAGCGPVGSCHQVGAAEDQGAAGRAASPLVASPTIPHASPQKSVASNVCVCLCLLSRIQIWTQIQVEKESTLSLPLKEACRWIPPRK